MRASEKQQDKLELLCKARQELIAQWLESMPGEQFVMAEKALLDRQLERLFGMHLMQLSALPAVSLFDKSPVNHCFSLDRPVLATELQKDSRSAGITDFEYLPLDQHSVDVAVIHHVLEFSADPHAILREAARVVRPDGQLIVVLFNPWSLLSAQQLLRRLFKKKSWLARPISAQKMSDWLRLLDFSVESIEYVWHTPAVKNARMLKALRKLDLPLAKMARPLGGATVLSVKKRNVTMTPVKKRWRKLTPGLAVPIMKPSTNAAMQANDD